jgi:hypothetical protein
MKTHKLSDMTAGWFIGNFEPCAVKSAEFEVAVKHYKAGDCEATHHHKLAKEITLIVTGRVKMCGREFEAGDIICLDQNEATDFKALTDTTTTVVKFPSVVGDKYLGVADEQ